MCYEIIKEIVGKNERVIIAGNGSNFFICFKDEAINSYRRPTKECLIVVSQSLDYVAIGAKKYKNINYAKKLAKKIASGGI